MKPADPVFDLPAGFVESDDGYEDAFGPPDPIIHRKVGWREETVDGKRYRRWMVVYETR